MDVIASTAFGIEIDSHNDPKNQFVQHCKEIFKFSLASPRFILLGTLMRLLYVTDRCSGHEISKSCVRNCTSSLVCSHM